MKKIAQELLTVAKQVLAEGPIFDAASADSAVTKIKEGIKAPSVGVKKSTLGGDANVSIMILVSLDKKEDWPNNILENSRYYRMSLLKDGTLEMFSGGTKKSKFRKTKAKSVEDTIAKINKYNGELEKIEGSWY